MSRIALMRTAFDLMYYSGVSAVMRPLLQGQGVIFCLHHVTPGGGQQTMFAPNSNLEIAPEFLDDLIGLVKNLGFELISMDEVASTLKSKARPSVRFAAFTLDDGYRDNLIHAMPVFKAHACPFTVYVSPRIAEGTCELWWRILGDVIAHNSSVSGSLNGQAFKIRTESEVLKHSAWQFLVKPVQALPEYEQREWIKQFAFDHQFDWLSQCRKAAMTWDDIRSMNAEPLATIGAHTLNHYNLLKLPEADARREIIESKLRIETELGQPVEHFAYPYGNTDAASPREFAICQSAGFKTAVTTRLGNIFPQHNNHIFGLPRIMVSGRFQKKRYIQTLMSGLPAFAANKLHRLNVG
jgi:peptidoglycan/xylan/chitin deacetylase (PgdA/CDA1 family)